MSRASVFLSTALLVAFLGVAADNQVRAQTSPRPSSAQTSPADAAGSSQAKSDPSGPAAQDPVPNATTVDRNKRIEPGDEASSNLAAGAPLPQTSTILPLLGFIGLGSLVAGLFARR